MTDQSWSAHIEDVELRQSLTDWRDRGLPRAVRAAVEAAMQQALATAIQATPVDTAQARAAWVAALQELGAVPPAGWTGPQPVAERISSGAQQGRLAAQEADETYELTATNAVPYIGLLDAGSRGMPPRHIRSVALQVARQQLLHTFRRALLE